jgi:hypothetical protein
MRSEDHPTSRKQVQEEVPCDDGETAVTFDDLLASARRRDPQAIEAILSLFEKDIHTLSRKANYIGIPEDEARQYLLLHFIELLVEGDL